jgi:hypothetical protein
MAPDQMTKAGAAVAVLARWQPLGAYWNLCKYLWDFNAVVESEA